MWHPSTQVGFLGTEQGRKRHGGSGEDTKSTWHLTTSTAGLVGTWPQLPPLCRATGQVPLAARKPPSSLYKLKAPIHAGSAFTPSWSSPIMLPSSFLIHKPGPCLASILCKNLRMACFQRGRPLGMAILRDERQMMPTAAQAAHSRVPEAPSPSLPALHTEAWLPLKERAAI